MIPADISIKFLVFFQIAVDVFLIALIFLLFRSLKIRLRKSLLQETSESVMETMEPLFTQAHDAAAAFDKQLKEKNHLINRLNEKLDARIISLNLLLNRTEAFQKEDNPDPESSTLHVYDQQESIVQLHLSGKTSTEIAKILSIPKGEIDLVLDLKKKLIDMQ